MADLDIEALEKQLQELRAKRLQARERLDATRGGRGRGRGPPGMGGMGHREQQRTGVFSRLGFGGGPRDGAPAAADGPGSRATVFDRLYGRGGGPRSADRAREWDRDKEPPHRSNSAGGSGREDRDTHTDSQAAAVDPSSSRLPIASRLSSRVVSDDTENRHEQRNGILARANSGSREDAKQPEGSEQPAAAAAPSRKRLLSAVVVNGEARTISASLDDPAAAAPAAEEPPAKRPAVQLDDRSKRRARRLLGVALQGTLKKAKDEDAVFRASIAAQRRQELERRAIEKAEAEDARRREEAAAARQKEREQQINSLLEINLKSDITVLELLYAKRIKRKQELLGFCVTKTQPPLYWAPRDVTEESQALLQSHAAEFDEWKQQQLVQLEADKADLVARAAAKRELAAQHPAGVAAGEQQQEDGEQQDREAAGEEGQEQEQEEGEEVAAGNGDEAMEMEVAEGDEEGVQQEEAEPDGQPEEQEQEQLDDDYAEAGRASRGARRRQLGPDEEEEEEEERLLSSGDEDE